MPRGDGTGPMGMGPVGAGRGYGARGRAGGYGCRRMYYETGLPGWVRSGDSAYGANEREFLAQEADRLEARLKQVREKMAGANAASEETREETQGPEDEAQ